MKKVIFGLLIFSCLCISNVHADFGDGDLVVKKQCKYEANGKAITTNIIYDTTMSDDQFIIRVDQAGTDPQIYTDIHNYDGGWLHNGFDPVVYFRRYVASDNCPAYLVLNTQDSLLYFGDSQRDLDTYRNASGFEQMSVYNFTSSVRHGVSDAPSANDIFDDPIPEDDIETVCGVLTQKTKDFIYKILDWIKYIALLLTIGLSVFDFFKAASSDEDNVLSKVSKKFATRTIVVVILFLLPVILKFVLRLIHIDGVDPSNPMCQ